MIRALLITAVVLGQAACASPTNSKRPVARDISAATTSGSSPERRGILGLSLRPLVRTPNVERLSRKQQKLLQQGAVCGDIALQGEAIGRVPGEYDGCGVENAVRLRAVSGVSLSQSAVMDCKTASSLKKWVEGSAKPALSGKGGGLKALRVAAHYTCRTRNNQDGAIISEHGRGRAIDISGFQLANGQIVSVLEGGNAKTSSKALRNMHKGACGPFGTVLGPNSDRFHRDHFHFDTARYRSGSYCR